MRIVNACLIAMSLAVTALSNPSAVRAQPHGHRTHPLMPGQSFVFRCQVRSEESPRVVEVPVELASPLVPADLTQVVELPAPLPPIRLIRYLPHAKLEQNVVPDTGEGATSAVLVSIKGPKQSYQNWLVAGDPDRNRLISFIATWRYMTVENKEQRDDLYSQFEKELTRDPMLIATGLDGSNPHRLPLRIGEVQDVPALKCKFLVRSFFHDYAIDDAAKKPVDRSDKNLNPAALVEITRGDKRQVQWVFAKFPDFQIDEVQEQVCRITLDCPLHKQRDTPDFAIVTIGKAGHEMWMRHQGKCVSQPLETGKTVPITGSRYGFGLDRFVPRGRLVEKYTPAGEGGGVPALALRPGGTPDADEPIWLTPGKARAFGIKGVTATVSFDHKRQSPPATTRPHPGGPR